MKRISLSLPHPLSRSLSFGRTITPIGGFSGKSPKFDPESVPKKLAARHTEDRINHSRQEKILFLPSRDPQNLDLDAMYLDLESFRLPNQETARSRQRGFHSSAPTPPTSRETETQREKKSTARPGPPHYIHSLHPQNTTKKDPQLLFPILLILLRRPTSHKTKNAGQNRKDGELVLGSDF